MIVWFRWFPFPRVSAKIPRGFTLSSFAALLGCTHRGVVGPRWGDEVDTHFRSAIASMGMVYSPTWRVQFRCSCSSTKTQRNQTTGMFMQWLHSPEKLCEGFKISAFFVAWPGGQFVVVFWLDPFWNLKSRHEITRGSKVNPMGGVGFSSGFFGVVLCFIAFFSDVKLARQIGFEAPYILFKLEKAECSMEICCSILY